MKSEGDIHPNSLRSTFPSTVHPFLIPFLPFQTYEPLLRASQDKNVGPLDDLNMPMYFNFLTIMAIHAFIEEQVDVAVVEVGIGGEFDCTNVIPSPIVCGVSSLGLDHTDILGIT